MAPKIMLAPKTQLAILVCDLTIGFGNATATLENLPTGFGGLKPRKTNYVCEKAVRCCDNYCCCMYMIKRCSKLNDRLVATKTQFCTALSFLDCNKICHLPCCEGSN